MNPHSTYANLSDEERAGLDARGPETRAGAELLAFWQMHRYLAHSVKMDEPDALADDIAKVERQAVAAYKTGLAEAVRALEGLCHDYEGLGCEAHPCVFERVSFRRPRPLGTQAMTDTEAIALRADSARERHVETCGEYIPGHGMCALSPDHRVHDAGREFGHAYQKACASDAEAWPCDAASLAADIPELLARVRALEGALRTLVDASGPFGIRRDALLAARAVLEPNP